jgi:hypothetical protein
MYNFTPNQLDTIHDMLAISTAYRWYHELDESTGINTTDVEEWMIEFFNAYNKINPGTY